MAPAIRRRTGTASVGPLLVEEALCIQVLALLRQLSLALPGDTGKG